MSKNSKLSMPTAKEVAANFVPHIPFSEYSEKYREHVIMERRDGVIMLRMHTQNKPIVWCAQSHRAVQQAIREAGADPENEVMILTATGGFWVAYGTAADDTLQEATNQQRADASMAYFVGDGMPLQENIVYDVRIPTIGVINGPGYHMDMALFCDLTICTDDTVMIDVHRWMGFVSGDGINVAMQGTMGIKRANYAMLLGLPVSAQEALDWGMVNEVVPRDKIYQRGWELGKLLMKGGKDRRVFRRMTTEIMRKWWKTRLSEDFFGGFAAEMYGYMADPNVSHDDTALKDMWDAAGIELPKW